ncbi:MAG: hypothetical protein ABL984_17205 [Pyrinomonadaceae bacterium]
MALCVFIAGCSSIIRESSASDTKSEVKNILQTNEETPFACNPTAIKAEDKPRYKDLAAKVKSAKEEVKETDGGYALRYESSSETIRDLAEFITYERACCPFIQFEMVIEKDNGAAWLKMEGGKEIKEILKQEFLD